MKNCSHLSVYDVFNFITVGYWLVTDEKWMGAIKKHLLFEKTEGSGFYTSFKLPGALPDENLKADFERHVRTHMEPGKQDLLEAVADIDIEAVKGFESLYVKICFALVLYHTLRSNYEHAPDHDPENDPEKVQDLLAVFG